MINYSFIKDVKLANKIKKLYMIKNSIYDGEIQCTNYEHKMLVDNEEEIINYCDKANNRLQFVK